MEQPPASFAEWLRAGLAARGLSQRQLAARSGVDHSTISRLLQGRTPTYDTYRRIAHVLDGDVTNVTVVEAALRRDPVLDPSDVAELIHEYRRRRALRLHRAGFRRDRRAVG